MATEIRVPTLGESVSEATIGTWFKKVGDTVKADEPIVELETDKVTVEVPAPASGVLTEIIIAAGETVGLNALLGLAEATACRRQVLLGYFGEAAEPCGNCDLCDRLLPCCSNPLQLLHFCGYLNRC